MIELLLLANLHSPPNMTCQQVREVAETVLDSDMSQQDKQRFLSRLFGQHMMLKCLKK
jgi:hypothetical protein